MPVRAIASFRIIPAYAGSTLAAYNRDTNRADHPRIRGEHKIAQKGKGMAAGSSPHTRGAPVVVATPGRLVGIIPAYAGGTRRTAR